jgi:ER membrane protein complex subunit 1
MRFSVLFLLCSSIWCLAPKVDAVYADEAHLIDFQHILLGRPRRENTFFHQPSPVSRATLLYTLSEKLVLGAVNPKDGSLVWRQHLVEGAANHTNSKGFLRAGAGESTVCSALGQYVRAWDAASGRMVWEWRGEGSIIDIDVIDIAGGSKDVVALVESVDEGMVSISRMSATNGKQKWQMRKST